MMIEIRPARPSDAEEMAWIEFSATHSGTARNDASERTNLATFAARWRKQIGDHCRKRGTTHDPAALIASDGMLDIGIGAYIEPAAGSTRATLNGIYVLHSHERQGVATQIFKAIVERLVQQSIFELCLECHDQTAGNNFYVSHGAVRMGDWLCWSDLRALEFNTSL